MYHYNNPRQGNTDINRIELPSHIRQVSNPRDKTKQTRSRMLRSLFFVAVIVAAGASALSLRGEGGGLAQLYSAVGKTFDIANAITFSYQAENNDTFGPFTTDSVTTKISEDSTPPPKEDPKPTSTPEKPTPTHCSDGTAQKQCGLRQPLFCKDGELKDRCSSCGCPGGLVCDTESERCVEQNAVATGAVPDSYTGRVQMFVYKTDRDKKLFKKTTHTAELHVAVSEMNAEVEAGIHRVILEVPGYDLVTITGISFPVTSFDSKWPEFMRRAYR